MSYILFYNYFTSSHFFTISLPSVQKLVKTKRIKERNAMHKTLKEKTFTYSLPQNNNNNKNNNKNKS